MHNYQQLNLKQKQNKPSKQPEQELNDRNGDHLKGYQLGGEWGKGTENKQHKWQAQNRQGEVKNSIENVKPKNLYARRMDMNQRRDCWREWEYLVEGGKGGKFGTTVIA